MKQKNFLLMLVLTFSATSIMTAQVPSYVPTNGLVGYWPFNGNANDMSTNANNGTNNGATLTADRFGNTTSAYNFDGSSQYISVLDNQSLKPSNSLSLSAWIYFDSNDPTNFNGIISKMHSQSQNYSSYQLITGNKSLNQGGQTGLTIRTTQSYKWTGVAGENIFNKWQFICGTWDGSLMKFYQNGVLIATVDHSGTLIYNTENLLFGKRKDGLGFDDYFMGKLDDIGIWNRALTQEEITNLYYAENTCQSLVINTGVLGFNPITYNNTVTIYPNPANDHITIDCGNLANVSGWNIKIYNTLSQEVFSGAMNQQKYTIPLNTWGGQGVYFVKIYDASNNLMNTKKIILQ